MEVDRRSLMKGMLACGAFLALGVPSWAFASRPARRPAQCMLVLSGIGADEAFARGTRMACAAMAFEGSQIAQLKSGVLTDVDEMVKLLDCSRGVRMIVVLDEASAVIFLELARQAGAGMLSMGTHACSTEMAWSIRHELASTSQDHSAGSLLASQLMLGQHNFSIMESHLHDTSGGASPAAWSARGFDSYRSFGQEPIHLHCSGLSLREGCRLLNFDTAEQWVSIPPQVSDCDAMTPRSRNWIEAVGYAVTASALGMASVKETCCGRAFLHRTTNSEAAGPQARFMSFVMDL